MMMMMLELKMMQVMARVTLRARGRPLSQVADVSMACDLVHASRMLLLFAAVSTRLLELAKPL